MKLRDLKRIIQEELKTIKEQRPNVSPVGGRPKPMSPPNTSPVGSGPNSGRPNVSPVGSGPSVPSPAVQAILDRVVDGSMGEPRIIMAIANFICKVTTGGDSPYYTEGIGCGSDCCGDCYNCD